MRFIVQSASLVITEMCEIMMNCQLFWNY